MASGVKLDLSLWYAAWSLCLLTLTLFPAHGATPDSWQCGSLTMSTGKYPFLPTLASATIGERPLDLLLRDVDTTTTHVTLQPFAIVEGDGAKGVYLNIASYAESETNLWMSQFASGLDAGNAQSFPITNDKGVEQFGLSIALTYQAPTDLSPGTAAGVSLGPWDFDDACITIKASSFDGFDRFSIVSDAGQVEFDARTEFIDNDGLVFCWKSCEDVCTSSDFGCHGCVMDTSIGGNHIALLASDEEERPTPLRCYNDFDEGGWTVVMETIYTGDVVDFESLGLTQATYADLKSKQVGIAWEMNQPYRLPLLHWPAVSNGGDHLMVYVPSSSTDRGDCADVKLLVKERVWVDNVDYLETLPNTNGNGNAELLFNGASRIGLDTGCNGYVPFSYDTQTLPCCSSCPYFDQSAGGDAEQTPRVLPFWRAQFPDYEEATGITSDPCVFSNHLDTVSGEMYVDLNKWTYATRSKGFVRAHNYILPFDDAKYFADLKYFDLHGFDVDKLTDGSEGELRWSLPSTSTSTSTCNATQTSDITTTVTSSTQRNATLTVDTDNFGTWVLCVGDQLHPHVQLTVLYPIEEGVQHIDGSDIPIFVGETTEVIFRSADAVGAYVKFVDSASKCKEGIEIVSHTVEEAVGPLVEHEPGKLKASATFTRSKSLTLCVMMAQRPVYDWHGSAHVDPVCKDYTWGDTCQECPGGSTVETACSGHGECDWGDQKTGVCTCELAFYGDDCSGICPGITNSTIPCNGNGVCSSDGLCVCNPNFFGEGCENECAKVGDAVCNGHGVCEDGSTGSGDCVCDPGFSGFDCDGSCPGGASKACHGHGECFESQCDCFTGYYGESDSCESECPGGADNPCSGNGQCVDNTLALSLSPAQHGQCLCEAFYGMEDCSALCPSAISPIGQLEPCAGQTCNSGRDGDGKCQCDPGSYGLACDMLCPTDELGVPCSGFGECEEDPFDPSSRICVCDYQHVGLNCGLECPMNAFMEVCSRHGDCEERNGEAVCTCYEDDPFQLQPLCSECPTAVGGTICSGHGTCTGEGCVCESAFAGEDCNSDFCSTVGQVRVGNTCMNCPNGGICDEDTMVPKPGFWAMSKMLNHSLDTCYVPETRCVGVAGYNLVGDDERTIYQSICLTDVEISALDNAGRDALMDWLLLRPSNGRCVCQLSSKDLNCLPCDLKGYVETPSTCQCKYESEETNLCVGCWSDLHYCGPGYKGEYCSQCKPDHYMYRDRCIPCELMPHMSSGSMMPMSFAFYGSLLLLFLFSSKKNLDIVGWSLTQFQWVALIGHNVRLCAGPMLDPLIGHMNILLFDFTTLATPCLFGTSTSSTLIFFGTLLAPIAGLLVPTTVIIYLKYSTQRQQEINKGSQISELGALWDRTVARMSRIIFMILHLVYYEVLRVALGTVHCRAAHATDGALHLVKEMQVQCFRGSHIFLAASALTLGAVLVFGPFYMTHKQMQTWRAALLDPILNTKWTYVLAPFKEGKEKYWLVDIGVFIIAAHINVFWSDESPETTASMLMMTMFAATVLLVLKDVYKAKVEQWIVLWRMVICFFFSLTPASMQWFAMTDLPRYLEFAGVMCIMMFLTLLIYTLAYVFEFDRQGNLRWYFTRTMTNQALQELIAKRTKQDQEQDTRKTEAQRIAMRKRKGKEHGKDFNILWVGENMVHHKIMTPQERKAREKRREDRQRRREEEDQKKQMQEMEQERIRLESLARERHERALKAAQDAADAIQEEEEREEEDLATKEFLKMHDEAKMHSVSAVNLGMGVRFNYGENKKGYNKEDMLSEFCKVYHRERELMALQAPIRNKISPEEAFDMAVVDEVAKHEWSAFVRALLSQ